MLPFMTAVYDDSATFSENCDYADNFLSNHVANRASRLQGRAFFASAIRIFGEAKFNSTSCASICPDRGHLAPVFGLVVHNLNLKREAAIRLFLFWHLRGWLASAVRLGFGRPARSAIPAIPCWKLRRGNSRPLPQFESRRYRPDCAVARFMAGRARPPLFAAFSKLIYEHPYSRSRSARPHARASRSPRPFSRTRTNPRARLQPTRLHRRRRRPGRQRQDRAHACVVLEITRTHKHRRRDQRYFHQGRRRIPHPQPRAARGTHPRRRNRRLPPRGDP